MRFLKIAALFVLISNTSAAQIPPAKYFFLANEKANMWCGYTNEEEFQNIAEKLRPLESSRVLFVSGSISEITYQMQSESGDWNVIDNYRIYPTNTFLQRAFIFSQNGISVIMEGRLMKGKKSRLHVVRAVNPDGSKVNIGNLDFPIVAIKVDPINFVFVKIARSMKKSSLTSLCVPNTSSR